MEQATKDGATPLPFCSRILLKNFGESPEEGLPPKKAILATAHKLLRVLFAMLSSKSCFRKGVVEV